MLKRLTIFCVCGAALIVAGCGGGGGGGGTLTSYVGNYAGTWNAPSQGSNGNLTMTVAADNSVTGTMTGATYVNGTGIVSGSLPPSGQFSGQIAYDANHTYTFQGPASFSTQQTNHLVGTINQDFVGVTIPINFDVVKQ